MVQSRIVGRKRNVSIEVAAWDGAMADVDLSCACMFTHEVAGSAPQGGLAHLDTLLDGRLVQLRHEGVFRAEEGETMFIDRPPAAIAARSVLIVGLGDPEPWTPEVMRGAVGKAFAAAALWRAASVAFAPSLLDSGLEAARTGDVAEHMAEALTVALDRDSRLRSLGLREAGALTRWIFDVGEGRFESKSERFRAALSTGG